MCRSAGQRQRGRTARCWGAEGSGRRPAKRPQPPFCSDAASLQRGLFSPGKPETGKKKLAKPAVDSVSLPTLHLIQKPFAPASPRVGRAPPAVVIGVRVRTGPSRFNRPAACTVDSRYFFKDKRVCEKMSEIKTLTLLSSPVACEGPRPVCGAGPRAPAGWPDVRPGSWGEPAAIPSPCPPALPGNGGERSPSPGPAPRPSPSGRALPCATPSRAPPAGETEAPATAGPGRGGAAGRPHTAPPPARRPGGFSRNLSVPIRRWQRAPRACARVPNP